MGSEKAATFDEQYQALRSGCGAVELTRWSSITVSGSDRQQFLHNFCTNDIKRLKPGDSCEAFFTNVKGKIVGHGIASCRADELVIVSAPGRSAALMEHLDCYIIREDVHLSNTSSDRRYVLVAGGTAATNGVLTATRIRCELVGSECESLVEVPTSELPSVLTSLQNHGAVLAPAAFDSARIEAGTPLFGVDFDPSNFPQEVGRDQQAISFTKGCYLGQETVARIDALGHVNQRLVGVRFFSGNELDAPMELSQAGKAVGHVTSHAYSPQLNAPIALAMVRREANAVGTRLDSPVGGCEVIQLPLL